MEYNRTWVGHLAVILFLAIAVLDAVVANEGYLVVHPEYFRPGTEEHISVTIFEPSQPITVQARLVFKNETIASTELTIVGKGKLKLQVPSGVRGRITLEVCGNCEIGATGYHFKNSTDVDVSDKGTSVFIQTDKPVYKPSQRVFINFIMTGPDLRPKNEKMLAYIVDPQGSRMIQWRKLQPLCCGIINTSFPLSDQPMLGEWSVYAEVQGHTYNKTFEVQKYVLPRFEVIIEPPSYIADITKCTEAIVRARYLFGKPVQGKMSINMNLHGLGYYNDYIGENNYMFMDIDGSAKFNICISDLITSPLKNHFRGIVHIEASVTSNDGNVFVATDDSCLVQKQLVSLEFSKDSRKHYKPGLPYYGRVLLYYPDKSPANNVTVEIVAEVKQDPVFSKNFVSSNGVVDISIPSLPPVSGHVWINAKVIAIDGKDAGDTYFSHYLSLGSWYSPSECHLLLRSLQENIKVGDTAVIGVQSTCPCNFTMHYEVMSRGNIVTSGLHDAMLRSSSGRNDGSRRRRFSSHPLVDQFMAETGGESDSGSCRTTFQFEVTHAMAPLSHLLAYYMRGNDEGVADTIVISVEPSFENEVKVQMAKNETLPGSKMRMMISAKPGSCICVASVDQSVQLLRPGYQVTTEKIFVEMENYDITEDISAETTWWGGAFRRRKRSTMWMRSRDANFAFREAGLKVMTDKIHLNFHNSDSTVSDDDWVVVSAQDQVSSLERNTRRKRAFFPETWMWQCFNLSSSSSEEHIQMRVPDTITTWMTDVIAMSPTHGLGVAETVQLTTFKNFFVEFTLPYSVIRGEQLRLPVTVYNYFDRCVQVDLIVHVQDGVRFMLHSERHQAHKLCLQAQDTETTYVTLIFSELGRKKIHASAEAMVSPDCCVGPVANEGIAGSDKITKNLLVEPEGIERGYAYSVFFCPNERTHISTPNRYSYQFVEKEEGMDFFTFMCKAKNDAHIALAATQDSYQLYEIVLGGWDNTRSWIARSKRGDALETDLTSDIVSWDEFRAFWISWQGGNIQVGHGEVPSNESVIMSWQDDNPMPVQYIGFTTGSGSLGEFRIWKKKGSSEIYREAFTLSLPLNHVPGSERAAAVVIGDVMGPTLNNLHNLIRLPFGCGEQNMIHFAPIVYVMHYLQHTNQMDKETEIEANTFLVQGYQRQLTYRRHSGSYSAFGESDTSGSMWLTAFVLKSFSQSRRFIFIDPKELEMSKKWIIAHQQEDGSFPPVGKVLNKDIQGGIQGNSRLPLTAYVLVALMEAGVESDAEKEAVSTAQKFLEDNVGSIVDPYTAALMAYALTLRNSPFAAIAVRVLSSKAIRRDSLTYWRLSGEALETLPFFSHVGDLEQTVTSAEVEMTAYALLTYTARGDIAYSLPIVKWLTQQRNAHGGFSSTQDTCVALQALAEYATLAYVGRVNLNISLAYTDLDLFVEDYYHLNNENSQVLQVKEIPVLSKTLFLSAYGEGCGLLQINMKYNIPDPTGKPAFKLTVNMIESVPYQTRRRRYVDSTTTENLTPPHDNYMVTMEVCTRWLYAGSSNMAVIEVSLITGFTADIESLDLLLRDKYTKVKRYEIDGRKVILYFDEIPSQCMTCISFDAYQDFVVGKTHAVPVKVYDYYEPHFEASKFYNVSRDSPLARELCEDDHCNQVHETEDSSHSAEQPAMENYNPENCNSISGDCQSTFDLIQCMCERTCDTGGPKVCASNNVTYDTYCHMEVAACQLNENLEAMPLSNCPEKPDEAPTPEGSAAIWGDHDTEEPDEQMSQSSDSSSYSEHSMGMEEMGDHPGFKEWDGMQSPWRFEIESEGAKEKGRIDDEIPDVMRVQKGEKEEAVDWGEEGAGEETLDEPLPEPLPASSLSQGPRPLAVRDGDDEAPAMEERPTEVDMEQEHTKVDGDIPDLTNEDGTEAANVGDTLGGDAPTGEGKNIGDALEMGLDTGEAQQEDGVHVDPSLGDAGEDGDGVMLREWLHESQEAETGGEITEEEEPGHDFEMDAGMTQAGEEVRGKEETPSAAGSPITQEDAPGHHVHSEGDSKTQDDNLSAGNQQETSEESPTQLAEEVAPVRLGSPGVIGLDTMINDEAGVAVNDEGEEGVNIRQVETHKTTKERRTRELRKA
ncbi:C3 and PZP-like alpha-2-macroglobulin domain-containing protein 8 isoform X2 [Acanthaster planci]|uniref:C3 and PZP-like alpha-2-macroglobulin domain-containing protein 8 isoform X2 n=1 Tax=Acanthaster planci TaxID=133434 RepID=A0A8B7Y226_ACAPL|nr:C3 and PZP-like alpha-2-macroglobulin domain-containing protein 8 isoform X2 [Acanthaster planci]